MPSADLTGYHGSDNILHLYAMSMIRCNVLIHQAVCHCLETFVDASVT